MSENNTPTEAQIADQTALASEGASIAAQAGDLFARAGLWAKKCGAICPDGFHPSAFRGNLASATPLDAAGLLMMLAAIEELSNSTRQIGGQSVVLGSAVLRMGVKSR